MDKAGNVFYDPKTDAAFTYELVSSMPENVPVICSDHHINDKEFAELLVKQLMSMVNWQSVIHG